MAIELPSLDLPNPTPGVGFSVVNIVTCPIVIICLSLFSALIGVTNMDAKKSEKGRITYSRCLAFMVIAITMMFLYLFTTVLLGTDLDANRALCETTYDILSAFWIVGKVTIYLWFQEKLHIRRFMAGLQDRRLVPWTIINIIITAPFTVIMYYIFADRESKIKGDGCNIGVTHSSSVGYALAYFIFMNTYICIHFLHLFPAIRFCLLHHRPSCSPNPPFRFIEILRSPPFPIPTSTYASRWGKYCERRAAINLAIFNSITSIAPIVTCVLMLSLDEGLGGPWWTFAVVVAADLVIAAFGIGIWEQKLWNIAMKEWEPEEQERKVKMARETGLCPSCGQGRGLVVGDVSAWRRWWPWGRSGRRESIVAA